MTIGALEVIEEKGGFGVLTYWSDPSHEKGGLFRAPSYVGPFPNFKAAFREAKKQAGWHREVAS